MVPPINGEFCTSNAKKTFSLRLLILKLCKTPPSFSPDLETFVKPWESTMNLNTVIKEMAPTKPVLRSKVPTPLSPHTIPFPISSSGAGLWKHKGVEQHGLVQQIFLPWGWGGTGFQEKNIFFSQLRTTGIHTVYQPGDATSLHKHGHD